MKYRDSGARILFPSLQGIIRFASAEMSSHESFLLGVLPGEGIGPEVVQASLEVLSTVAGLTGVRIRIVLGGPIGNESEELCGKPLSDDVIEFCRNIFREGGAILCGPGGGRFVYDLRKEFDLFCKIIPVNPSPTLKNSGVLRRLHTRNIDILLVRENASGLYQGRWIEGKNQENQRFSEHLLHYQEKDVIRILQVGARLAADRSGMMTVVIKDGGLPAFTRLWRDCAAEVSADCGVRCIFMNVDLAAYSLIQYPQEMDVLVSSNLFGDILGDLSAVLLGSRAVSYGASFSASGAAVYQTNHGAASGLKGLDVANPAGQILSLAMLLRESFGLVCESELIQQAVARVWKQGFRTADLKVRGGVVIGTSQFTKLVCESVVSSSSPVRIPTDR